MLTLHDIRRTWESARRSIVEQVAVEGPLADWRSRAARVPPDMRVAAFVAGCALRLALVDALPPDDPAAAIQPTTQNLCGVFCNRRGGDRRRSLSGGVRRLRRRLRAAPVRAGHGGGCDAGPSGCRPTGCAARLG